MSFWLAAIALSPLLLCQALWSALRTPRLPEAAGARTGLVEAESRPRQDAAPHRPLQMLVAGESTAVGVGVARLDDALAGRLAAEIARRTGRRIAWQVVGANGARVERLPDLLAGAGISARTELALLPMGVNDTVKLSSTRRWLAAVQKTTDVLRTAGVNHIAWASVPPVGWFTALPNPLRFLLGVRAGQLDRALQDWAAQAGDDVSYLPVRLPPRPELLAEDGYHPGPRGYRLWASLLADQLQALDAIRPLPHRSG